MIDIEALTRPLSEAAPCGPDLDAEGDPDYLNLMARVEGDLPGSFFSFDRASIDFEADAAALAGLLARSRDLRPVVALAKLAVLNRDLEGFVGWLSAAAALLAARWGAVHPAVDNGEEALRSAVLQSLDDLPTVILPLQYMPLVTSRRFGALSFRTQLVAAGEAARREGEPEVDAAGVEQALAGAEAGDVVALRDLLARGAEAVEAIRGTWIAEAGFDGAPALERLRALSARMLAFVGKEAARRAPDQPTEEAAGSPPAGAEGAPEPAGGPAAGIGSARRAAEALAAVVGYLSAAEPSNPALLVVCQAQQLVGRSFAEIVQILMPDAYGEARIAFGAKPVFALRLDQLPGVAPFDGQDGIAEEADDPENESDGSDEDSGEAGDVDGADGKPGGKDAPEAVPDVAVRSRGDVQQVLDEVAAFYRAAEPSNPIPLLCERARGLCSLDFVALIRDMMPQGE